MSLGLCVVCTGFSMLWLDGWYGDWLVISDMLVWEKEACYLCLIRMSDDVVGG